MKKIVITAVVAVGIVVIVKLGIPESLLMLLLVGAIPGTSYSIPSIWMLVIIGGLLWATVFACYITVFQPRISTPPSTVSRSKQHTSRRRYQQI